MYTAPKNSEIKVITHSKTNYLIESALILMMAVAMMVGVPTKAHAAGAFSDNAVQYSWFYKPAGDGTTATSLAASYNNFILTKNDEANRDALRTAGVTTPMLEYVRIDAIQDPGNNTCPNTIQPYRNQVAWQPGDFCTIQASHPDWFLRKADGTMYCETDPTNNNTRWCWMDPANQGWREFWLSRVKTNIETTGWDGAFLDNVQASIGQFTRKGVTLMNYPDDGSLQVAISDFLAFIYGDFFYPKGYALQGNIINLPWASAGTDVWNRYLQNLDGAMEEDFSIGWRSGEFRSASDWEIDMKRMELTQTLGKRAVLVAQGDKTDTAREEFALASYLLIANGKASFRYTNSSYYNQSWSYTNYSTALGNPKAARYLASGIWRRDFDNGYVTADPVNHVGSIVVNAPAPTPTPTPAPTVTTTTTTTTQTTAPTVTATVTPVHITKLTMWYTKPTSTTYRVSTEVRVRDANGGYTPGVSVTLKTVLPNKTQTITILPVDAYGIVTFTVDSKLKGTFTSTVTNLSGTGYSYDKTANVATTATKSVK